MGQHCETERKTEEIVSVFRERVVQHISNVLKNKLRDYLTRDVVRLVNSSNMESDGKWANNNLFYLFCPLGVLSYTH